eukprot:CAMPEP_0170516812 /NCGR_PEP_ID=MMETSP0209-20121228/2948_1 /TAXON_ID=665100 ORGANISM="Litonotus pictus, Strain P1" /NCGR_SAMPLE_ID=MMETSP0209 /ASSEMBLY_ACC=CAM_ASM_000301 /LENGTH=54 /DNA_ID=CAMNT_0010801853 /DNA_START=60 /DNA_END=221 /DNA_ORIENTATION=+
MSFKSAVYKHSGPEDPNFKRVYSVSIEVIKQKKLLDEILEKVFDDGIGSFGVTW